MKRTALLLLAALAAGCAGPIKERVKMDLVRELPVESRIELLDAENGLFGAIDEVDDARNNLEDAEAAVDRADERIDEAKDQRKKAKKEHDDAAVEVAELAITEARAHKEFAEVEVKVIRAELREKEGELDVARGRYELAKCREVKRVNLEGSQKLKIEDFEKQVGRLEDRVKQLQADEEKVKAKADEQKKAWDDSRDALARATGGAQGTAFVE